MSHAVLIPTILHACLRSRVQVHRPSQTERLSAPRPSTPVAGRGGEGLDQLLLGDHLLESHIVLFEILQTLRLISPHAAVLVAPPVVGLFRYRDTANGIRHRRPVGDEDLDLASLLDDLLRGIPLAAHATLPCGKRYATSNIIARPVFGEQISFESNVTYHVYAVLNPIVV
jgi:hypothetical protein